MRFSVLLAALSIAAPTPTQSAEPDTFSNVDRIVAVGDVHGGFDQFVVVLRQAGVIDGKNRWSGGRTHLVQTGDVLDRGPDSRKVMDLLMALETEAERAGGKVHALIGNHEAMNVLGDLRYVSDGEYEAFRSPRAKVLRERAYAALVDSSRRDRPEYRAQWEAEHPLGWVEHRLAFEGNGRYGAWIREHNAVIKIDDYLFLHGGIGPKYVEVPIDSINRLARKDLEPGDGLVTMVTDTDGPLWYRGLAGEDEAALESLVDRALASFGVQHIVIGHTVTPGAIMPRVDGKVLMIDVGLSAVYGGPPACLVIEKGVPYALHRGQLVPIPMAKADRLAYLEEVAALDPPDSKLRQYLAQLEPAHTGRRP